MKKTALLLFFVSFTIGLLGSAQAAPLEFLKHSAFAKLSKEDLQTLGKALDNVLDNEVKAAAVPWQNTENGHGGTLTVLSKFEEGGKDCRRVRIKMRAEKKVQVSVYNFCRQPDGKWKIIR